MNTQDLVAVVALVVSLVALLTTLMQLLQQYFATADGYRRCQSSVMAGWSHWTFRKFRWSELRFETVFVVPDISFLDCRLSDGTVRKANGWNSDWCAESNSDFSHAMLEYPTWEVWKPMASKENRHQVAWTSDNEMKRFVKGLTLSTRQRVWFRTRSAFGPLFSRPKLDAGADEKQYQQFSPEVPTKSDLWGGSDSNGDLDTRSFSTELACWVRLLRMLYKLQVGFNLDGDSSKAGPTSKDAFAMRPIFSARQWSWDFMAPDITRPYARCSISDLIIITRILGMKWYDCDVNAGMLRAEGRSSLLTSRLVSSVGTVVDIRATRADRFRANPTTKWIIPQAHVYAMMFGIVPGDPRLLTPHRETFGGDPRLNDELAFMIGDKDSWKHCLESYDISMNLEYLGADFVPLVAPIMRKKGSAILKIPKPYMGSSPGWLTLRRTFQVFQPLLKNYIKGKNLPPSSIVHQILAKVKHFQSVCGQFWCHILQQPDQMCDSAITSLVDFCDEVMDCCDMADAFIVGILETPGKITQKNFYLHLVEKHLQLLTQWEAYDEQDPDKWLLERNPSSWRSKSPRGKKNLDVPKRRSPDTSGNHAPAETVGREIHLSNKRLNDHPQQKLEFMFDNVGLIAQILRKRNVFLKKRSKLSGSGEHVDFYAEELPSEDGMDVGQNNSSTISEDEIEEMWIAMIFRGMCWLRCHIYDDGEPVSSDYWSSKHEIYIG